jgi:threonine-phosphate decarboxylase
MQVKWEQHGHGGDTWTAAEEFGVPRKRLIDFSANINPLGPPQSVWRAIQEEMSSIVAYPDPQSRELKRALVGKWGHSISAEQVLVGNGAAEILYGVFASLAPRRVGVVQPCFSEYAEAAATVQADVVAVRARAEVDFLPELAELLQVCEQVDLFVVGHPNNPNGRMLPTEWLLEMAKTLVRRGAYLVVDEAFLDFLPRAQSLVESLDELPNVIVVRSMTKFYSIPGLRLGYAIATTEVVRQVERVLPPWRVNALAQVAGVAGVQDQEFAERTWAWLARERPFLVEGLEAILGIRVHRGEVNFVLFFCEVEVLQKRLGQMGILIRSCAEYPGLGNGYFRVAVRSRQENTHLLQVVQQVMKGAL